MGAGAGSGFWTGLRRGGGQGGRAWGGGGWGGGGVVWVEAVDECEIVGGGGEGELDGHLVERAQTELAQVALLFEYTEDRFDDGPALAIEMPALLGAHRLAHAAQSGIVAANVVGLVSKIQFPRQVRVRHIGLDTQRFHLFGVWVGD